MTLSTAIPQNVTNVSGTIAIASTSTSIGVAKVADAAPEGADILVTTAQQVISFADQMALFSVVIMTLSFLYTIWATNKKNKIAQRQAELDEKLYQIRKEELEFERAKLKVEDK